MREMDAARRWLRDAVGQVPAADRAIRRLRRTTTVLALEARLRALGASSPSSSPWLGEEVTQGAARFLAWTPPGHFYSPVPDVADAARHLEDPYDLDRDPAGVALRPAEQLRLFRALAALAREAPLAREPGIDTRYGTDNPNYPIGDAWMLSSMLRHLRPRHYLEVGSGYSTALALDVNERHLDGAMQLTAIEPYPVVLGRVTRQGDALELVRAPVQSVPVDRFEGLGANDVLFIDSSHVLKTWSDVQFLYTRVLPSLAPGVYVHVHDIFWPFEYPREWIEEGRAWNEAYLLHAFLACNQEFEIVLWTHYLAVRHREVVAAELPEMLENPGASLWMRRRLPD